MSSGHSLERTFVLVIWFRELVLLIDSSSIAVDYLSSTIKFNCAKYKAKANIISPDFSACLTWWIHWNQLRSLLSLSLGLWHHKLVPQDRHAFIAYKESPACGEASLRWREDQFSYQAIMPHTLQICNHFKIYKSKYLAQGVKFTIMY